MANENNTEFAAGRADADAPTIIEAKKQRTPRRQKTTAETAPAISKVVNVPPPATTPAKVDGRGRRGKAKAAETKATGGARALRSQARKQTVKSAERMVNTPAPTIAELDDLIQLEEENKRLRKILTEKLREENAELRKRIGLA
jgi:hypothetical protein